METKSESSFDLSVIIVNYNTRELLIKCLEQVYQNITNQLRYEIIVVDNGSTDDSVSAVKKAFPSAIVVVNDSNLGFGAANNRAFSIMRGKYAILLNTDAWPSHGAFEELYHFMETHPDTAMACGQLLNPDGSLQNSVAPFPSVLTLLLNETLLGYICPKKFMTKASKDLTPREVSSCIGACMILRGDVIKDTRGFDERYFFFFEETDLARTIREKGWKVYFVPKARIYHLKGRTAGHSASARVLYFESRYKYFKKWYPSLFPVFYIIIFLRLLTNTILNGTGFLLTLGMSSSFKTKFIRYCKILKWHLKMNNTYETK